MNLFIVMFYSKIIIIIITFIIIIIIKRDVTERKTTSLNLEIRAFGAGSVPMSDQIRNTGVGIADN